MVWRPKIDLKKKLNLPKYSINRKTSIYRKTRLTEMSKQNSRLTEMIDLPKISTYRNKPFTESKTCFDFPIAKSPEVQLLSNHMVNIKDYFQPNQELLNLSNLLAHLVKLLSNFLCF